MKVLWLCNIVLPAVAAQLNIGTTVKEGWISGTLSRLTTQESDIDLAICCPVDNIDCLYKKDEVIIGHMKLSCYRFLEQVATPWVYDITLEIIATKIISDFKPDMIHCFGTEYPHTLAFAKVWNNKDKLLVGMQGVMQACAEAYCGGLDEKIVRGKTFRDLVKHDNIAAAKEKFVLRANMEKQALSYVGHAAGRTKFDEAAVLAIDDSITYHYLGETMREEFYSGEWSVDRLDDHVIFVSQADYPLKGFHVLLEALPEIIKNYPDTHVYVAGNSITRYESIKDKLRISNYGRYLRKLLYDKGIQDNVTVLGRLDAVKMKEQYLRSSVFVCTSFVENSPNSMGEAMLLGTPVIATRTGGIPSMAKEETEALFVTPGVAKELEEAVIRVFSNQDLAISMSKAARKRARINHDANANYESLLEIYRKICQ